MIKSILEKMGYKPESQGNSEWMRMKAIHRNSNSMSLAVSQKTGWFNDFVTGENGPLFKLAMITLNISEDEARKFLYGSLQPKNDIEENKIKKEKVFNSDFVNDLLPSYGFYLNRGISVETLKEFEGGVQTYGKLNNRFVFPIFDINKKIIGVAGRELFTISNRAKWKILGKKTSFIYPSHLSLNYIESSSEVVLVESIGDALALYQNGVKNILVMFGLSLSKDIILFLIRCNVQSIIVSPNNDLDSEVNRGLEAADKIKSNLCKFFKEKNVKIHLPDKKDFGEMNSEEIKSWYKNK